MSETEPNTPPSVGLRKRLPWYRRLVVDILYVANRDRTWWMLPLIILLLLLAGLLTLASIAGPLAPFIYPFL